jgi:hypothetical protein
MEFRIKLEWQRADGTTASVECSAVHSGALPLCQLCGSTNGGCQANSGLAARDWGDRTIERALRDGAGRARPAINGGA